MKLSDNLPRHPTTYKRLQRTRLSVTVIERCNDDCVEPLAAEAQRSVATLVIHSLMRRVAFFITLVLFSSLVMRGQSPSRAEQYYRAGIAKKAQGDLDGAITDYTRAIELNPRYAPAYVNRGVARKTKGDLNGAIADYNRAISLNPRLKEAYNNRGLACQLNGRLDDAIADFDKALELDPHYAGAHYNRASAAKAKGDLKKAIAELTRAINSPDNDHLSETYNNRGTIRHDDGDTEGSLADFTKAIEIDPRNVFAYVNRGYSLILLGKDDEAQKDFDQVLRLNPTLQSEVNATIKKARQERAAKKRVTSLPQPISAWS